MYRQKLLLCPILVFPFLLIQPQQSFPGENAPAEVAVNKKISDQASGDAVIGQIRTKDKVLIIRSSAGGCHYTVKTKDGELLADDLNTMELETRFPELMDVVENGFAGDASLRTNIRFNNKVPVKIEVKK